MRERATWEKKKLGDPVPRIFGTVSRGTCLFVPAGGGWCGLGAALGKPVTAIAIRGLMGWGYSGFARTGCMEESGRD